MTKSFTPKPLAALIALLSALPAAAIAQDAGIKTLEEVVVTSRRVTENLQQVPIAVSAFNAEDLARLQADSLDSLQGAVPNLNLVQGRGSSSSANIFIRGVGQPDALQTFDPAVGIYVDDVYISRIQGALFNLFDVERVEVLRGPQGTLYGKNTIGGALKLVTHRPSDELTGKLELTAGDYSRQQAKAYISGGLTDGLAGSVSFLTNQRDGFVKDPLTGKDYNDEDTQAGRIALRWSPTDNFEALWSYDQTRERVALSLGQLESDLIQTDFVLGPVILQPAPTRDWNRRTSTTLNERGGQELDHWGTSLILQWGLSDALTLKSITAYRELETSSYIDIDATVYEIGDVLVELDQSQTSQEFQLLFDDGGKFRGVAGLYYLKEKVPSHQEAYADDLFAVSGFPISFLRTIDDDLVTTSYAVFGQGTVDLDDRWSVTLGMRYTVEEKEYYRTTSTFSNNALFVGTFAFSDKEDWDAFTPSLTVDYRLSDDAMLYASASRGFKSGGFNGRANSGTDTAPFDPEYVWTYELGTKTTWNDGRIRANAAIFQSEYEDFQARVAEDVSNLPVINAGELEIRGAELEVSALVGESLLLGTQIGYLDAEYKEFFDARVANRDRSDDIPPFSPEWTLRFAAEYTVSIGEMGSVILGADTQFRDAMYLSVDNQDVLTQKSYWVSNARISWRSVDEKLTVTAGVKNLDDKLYKVDAQEFSAVGNIQTAYYGDPRTWTVSVGYEF